MIDTKKCDLIEIRQHDRCSMTKCFNVKARLAATKLRWLATQAGFERHGVSISRLMFERRDSDDWSFIDVTVVWGHYQIANHTTWSLTGYQIYRFESGLKLILDRASGEL